ncbi:arginine utilization protein RocB [Alsobacter soli]|uniref:Arginine utilization protein RocB n=1 Tax=Alsobacter soli TaxID=2109933 RepID=A0A2T1HY49_9HYPH|nr:M20/M25/M40 family metallo-hydrolase [Alsobacter soli]PSC06616.1 arginine utilization protein RocB [Alsobacter soli]
MSSEHTLAASARRWALELTRRRSVTGTADEASFGPWLAERLRREPAFGRAEVWSFPVAAGDGRHVVAMLIRGKGRRTTVLTGHYDTVSVSDYGELEPFATEPDALTGRLQEKLQTASSAAERRARYDLGSGAFLPARGLLDMKAGLAAGLAVAEGFAASPGEGNILFLAVPDEEANSAGARAAAQKLPSFASEHGLDLVAAVNLDAIADDGDGSDGRAIALGTVGKLLLTAFVAGRATHAGFPLAGLNAAVLAGAVAQRVEWAPELADPGWSRATPPSLLGIRDDKVGYDVTTPGAAFATFNVLFVSRTPAEILDRFDALCREALAGVLEQLRRRAVGASGAGPDAVAEVPVLRFEQVAAKARSASPGDLEAALAEAASLNAPLPERCRLLTERAWRASGLSGPAVVTGFGSVPYLPTRLSQRQDAQRLAACCERAAREAAGPTVRCTDVFAGISDMSFLGEADESSLALIGANTPAWPLLGLADRGCIAGLPIVNAGPWGRDYHTPLERMHVSYGFEVLPRMVDSIARRMLQPC